MNERHFEDLKDKRLTERGNRIMNDLFRKGCHSIRQMSDSDAAAKGCYRFLQNDRVSEADIIRNLSANCQSAARNKLVVCIQDTTEINLSTHAGRLQTDKGHLGTTNSSNSSGLGFFLHPSLVLDAVEGIPYGYAAIKLWNRSPEFTSNKHQRGYNQLPTAEKESCKWLEDPKALKTP